ncbi:hypothetical protein MNEG_14965 [Monoraphidium neglectum]|uniref:Uncharacterized protein n=1 Tax=Monoraphidium neglectum TaxID=145388 RepID=A0A0D2LMG3_9CHLO|nr:hypothetical protein MNEG_14965 [Monoraphidium neglectum]KIY92999.1 hypothetical protein MNEG_14965 [Monoraphidium neglectum]|eukprot:XP_013892019.1 hypothetical protein MNEG_14965 [Monoraphidium neglectum]
MVGHSAVEEREALAARQQLREEGGGGEHEGSARHRGARGGKKSATAAARGGGRGGGAGPAQVKSAGGAAAAVKVEGVSRADGRVGVEPPSAPSEDEEAHRGRGGGSARATSLLEGEDPDDVFFGYSVEKPPPLDRLWLPCCALLEIAAQHGAGPREMAERLLAMGPDELRRTAAAARAAAPAGRSGGAGAGAGGRLPLPGTVAAPVAAKQEDSLDLL